MDLLESVTNWSIPLRLRARVFFLASIEEILLTITDVVTRLGSSLMTVILLAVTIPSLTEVPMTMILSPMAIELSFMGELSLRKAVLAVVET